MRNTPVQILLICVGVLSLSWARDVPIVQPDAVPLRAVSGEGSILLVWSLPDSVEPRNIYVYRSESIDQNYRLIATLAPPVQRYLDRDVAPEVRYFYRVEIERSDGFRLASSEKTPPFSRCSEPVFAAKLGKPLTAGSIAALARDLFRRASKDVAPEAKPSTLQAWTHLVWEAAAFSHPWLEGLPPDQLQPVREVYSHWVSDSGDIVFYDLLNQAEPAFRNAFLLLPEEWTAEVDGIQRILADRIPTLDRAWAEDLDLWTALPGLIPLRLEAARADSTVLQMQFLHPEAMAGASPRLVADGDTIRLTVPDSLSVGSILSISLESYPADLQLAAQENHWQRLYTDSTAARIQYYLSGDVRREGDDNRSGIYWAPLPSPVRLNEWSIHTQPPGLTVELWNAVADTGRWGIRLGETLLWDMDFAFVPANTFLDTTLALEQPVHHPVLLSLVQREQDDWKVVSQTPLFPADAHRSRYPDGGSWELRTPTPGKSNSTEKFVQEGL
ncbi:MAG: hypothetical protein D6762_03915, partial [Candidatus Neomarinimicrobiota bacterium]